jgi:hypothetical protein
VAKKKVFSPEAASVKNEALRGKREKSQRKRANVAFS